MQLAAGSLFLLLGLAPRTDSDSLDFVRFPGDTAWNGREPPSLRWHRIWTSQARLCRVRRYGNCKRCSFTKRAQAPLQPHPSTTAGSAQLPGARPQTGWKGQRHPYQHEWSHTAGAAATAYVSGRHNGCNLSHSPTPKQALLQLAPAAEPAEKPFRPRPDGTHTLRCQADV